MQLNYSPVSIIRLVVILSLFSNPSSALAGDGLFRLKPSSPKELMKEIYNNVLTGNDRLSDIEGYMSSGLKNDYKKVVKNIRRGKTCDFPRILSNGIFSGKINGFRIEQGDQNYWTAQVDVVLDTGANTLREDDQLKKFDPNLYDKISFKLVRRLVDWKIDNIQSMSPNLNHDTNDATYAHIDLRKMLRDCK